MLVAGDVKQVKLAPLSLFCLGTGLMFRSIYHPYDVVMLDYEAVEQKFKMQLEPEKKQGDRHI